MQSLIKINKFTLVAGIIIIAYIIIEARGRGDFWVFLEAATRLRNGADIYTPAYGDGFHYFYSTLFALLLIPFTYFPPYVVHLLWLLADVFFAYKIWKIVEKYIDVAVLSKTQYLWFIILAWAFTFRFLYNNFHVIQMTIFLVYASLEGITLILNNKKIAGAALIALAINIKTLPVVLVPYLLYRNQLKAAGYVLFFLVFFFWLPSVFIGFQHNWYLLKEWYAAINPSRPVHVVDIDETGFHSLSAWLPTLLMENTSNNFTLPIKRNILNLDYHQVAIILTAARLLLVSFAIYFLRSRPFKSSPSPLHTFWELSYIFLLIPLLFPHQHIYAFFFLFPAGLFIVYFLIVVDEPRENKLQNRVRVSKYITVLSFLLLSIGGIIGTIDDFTQHFKFITYGALLLIIPLMLLTPDYLITVEKTK